MKYILLIASAAVLGILFARLIHFHVSWLIHFYVLWMTFVAVFACVVNKYCKDTQMDYATLYAICVGMEVIAAFLIAGRFAFDLGWDGITGLGVFIALGIFFAGAIRHRLPETPQARIGLLCAAGYCGAGLLALASLIPQCSALQWNLRFWFCLLWLSNGVYLFAECIGIVRSRALWESLDTWVSATLAIVCMGGLLVALRSQHEAGWQQQRDEEAVSLAWGHSGPTQDVVIGLEDV